MALLKDKGICIRSTDYSETSQILTFFTSENGKISVIAKGSRRSKSSAFSGPIEICSAGDLVYSIKEGEKLGTLTEYNPTFLLTGIRKKLLSLNICFLAAELLNLFTQEHDPHPELYDEAITFLKKLDESPENQAACNLIIFEFDLLTYTGSLPVTGMCTNCKRKFANDWKQYYFSTSAGGLICRDCEAAFVDKKTISFDTAKCLNSPQSSIDAAKAAIIQTQELLLDYITYVLEKKPRTSQMVLQLLKNL